MASAVNALKVMSDVPQRWKCTVMLLLELWFSCLQHIYNRENPL